MMLGPGKSPQLQLLMVMVMVMVIPEGASATNTCKAVTNEKESSVTCYFGLDIAESKHNFNIQFYHPDLDADPETLLMCNWVTAGQTECKKMAGVDFNNVISDQVIVKGPPMMDKVGGQYVCQVVPSTNVPAKPCLLNYSASPLQTPGPQESVDPEWLEEINERTSKSLTMSTVALVVVIIAVLIGVVVVFIIFRRKWIVKNIGKIRKGRKGGDEEENTEAAMQLVVLQDARPSTSAGDQKRLVLEKTSDQQPKKTEPKQEEMVPMVHDGDVDMMPETKQEKKDRENREKQEKKDRENREKQEKKDRETREKQEKKDRETREKQEKKDRENREKQEKKDRENREKLEKKAKKQSK